MHDATIVHVGDVAGVPQQLVAGLNELGVTATAIVPPVPMANGSRALKVLSVPGRLMAARGVRAQARNAGAALLHVHYATAAWAYLRPGVPLVVHAHGSDVRDPGRVDRLLLGRIWRSSALRLVSTPDLVDAVPRSQYLPNPVDTTAFRAAGAIVPDQDVFVFAALTDVKGGPRLVDAVRALRHIDPRVRVTAFAGDPYSERMGAAGATLIERVSPDDLPALVARHRVIIGQQRLGALGVSELQAMATGRPLVGHVRADLDYGTVDPPHAEAHEPESIAQATLTLLGDTAAATDVGEAGARWTVEHHDRRRVCRELLGRYSEVLGTDLLHHGEISP